ncbi:MAG: flagellar biosynthesis protein FlhB [Planctomycetota bacterium]
MADDMGEKTEAPTPRRLDDARKKGQVAKSQDLGGALTLLTAVLLFAIMGGGLLQGFAMLMRRVLTNELQGPPLAVSELGTAFRDAMLTAGSLAWPFLLIALIATFITQFVQVGPMFTTTPLKPKVDRLNPAAGIKRLVGMKNLVKSGMNLIKLVFAVSLASAILWWRMPTIAALASLGAAQGFLVLGRIALELSIALLVLLIAIGLIDLFYQKWQHKKDLKMTKHEVKDERRSMEGDPQVKRRRMEIARDIATQQVQQGTPQADVIVTNPTHFSVGIAYDAGEMNAPKVVVKGADLIAWRIRQLAKQHDIPIVERPPLARALYWGADVGSEIAPEHYEAVADVLAYVYRLDAEAAKRGGATRVGKPSAEQNTQTQEPAAAG